MDSLLLAVILKDSLMETALHFYNCYAINGANLCGPFSSEALHILRTGPLTTSVAFDLRVCLFLDEMLLV